MRAMLRSTFRSALIAAGLLFVLGGLACRRPPDAAKLAAAMKAKMPLPHKIDDDTRLDDVRAVGKMELGYFMTLTSVTKAQADANPALGNLLESTIRSGYCKNPNYEQLMKAGLTVRLVYASSDKAEVRNIVLLPKDCGL
jgi:uncharacterized protein YjeT (DUF2065 family)